jgi:hypothetical protein
MLDAKQIRDLHEKSYLANQATRENAASDLMFYWLTHWDGATIGSTLQYQGQFDMLRKAGRQIMSDIKSNPVQVDFEPIGDDDGSSDMADGMYRADMRSTVAQEAKDNAATETIVCGVGAWELYTKYKTNRRGDSKQVVDRRPIYEANNNVFWDANAKLADKSDATYVSCLVPYTEDGYKNLVEELTGEKDANPKESFAMPETSYTFPWYDSNELFYITRFYHIDKVKVNYLLLEDVLGGQKFIKESEQDDYNLDGFELVEEIEKEENEVTLYIVGGGDEVLKSYKIAGSHIPVIPCYGERAYIEGTEHYEGMVRLAKDPQRLRNFQLSYLADLASKNPRSKPIYFPEQIQNLERFYSENGADDQYPYALMNRKDANGNDLPLGAIGQTPETQVPPALIAGINASREAINDVAAEGLPQNITDLDLSGEAITQVQKLFDKQSFIYQHNMKTAERRSAEVWASMAVDVYADYQDINLVGADGTKKTERLNQEEIDPKTLQLVTTNDVRAWEFNVYADIGQNYNTTKEQARKELKEMINTEPPDSPNRQIMLLTYATMLDGIMFKNLRDYGRKQLIMQGIEEPETDEEIQMVQQSQQDQKPDPTMLIAQAEMEKAQAEKMNAQSNMIDKEVDMFNAETKRAEVMIKAKKAGVDIDLSKAKEQGVKIDNALKVSEQRVNDIVNRF